MDMSNNGPGMTYKYYQGNHALWPFGFGLTYATFKVSVQEVSVEQGPMGSSSNELVKKTPAASAAAAAAAAEEAVVLTTVSTFDAADGTAVVTVLVTVERTDEINDDDETDELAGAAAGGDGIGGAAAQLTVTASVRPLQVPALSAAESDNSILLRQLATFARTPDLLSNPAWSSSSSSSSSSCVLDLTVPADAFALADASGDLSVMVETRDYYNCI
jgi:hypothetical protein